MKSSEEARAYLENIYEQRKVLIKQKKKLQETPGGLWQYAQEIDTLSQRIKRLDTAISHEWELETYRGFVEVREGLLQDLEAGLFVSVDSVEDNRILIRPEDIPESLKDNFEWIEIQRDITHLDAVINAKLIVLKKEEQERGLDGVYQKLRAPIFPRIIDKLKAQRDAYQREANNTDYTRSRRAELSHGVQALNQEIAGLGREAKLSEQVQKSEQYLSSLNSAGPTTRDIYLDNRDDGFRQQLKTRPRTDRRIENKLRDSMEAFDKQIDARLKVLKSPMKGGSLDEVRAKQTDAVIFINQIKTALADTKMAFPDVQLPQLDALIGELERHRVQYNNYLSVFKSDDSVAPYDFQVFQADCNRSLLACAPESLQAEASAAIHPAAVHGPTDWMTQFLDFISMLFKNLFSSAKVDMAAQEEHTSSNATEKKVEAFHHFKDKAQGLMENQENQSPNPGNNKPKTSTPDDTTPQL